MHTAAPETPSHYKGHMHAKSGTCMLRTQTTCYKRFEAYTTTTIPTHSMTTDQNRGDWPLVLVLLESWIQVSASGTATLGYAFDIAPPWLYMEASELRQPACPAHSTAQTSSHAASPAYDDEPRSSRALRTQ